MRRFERAEEPEVLRNNAERWGEEWETRRRGNPQAAFHWHEVDGTKVNHLLMPTLKAQTQDHCSFCDAHPVSPPGVDTIEHFRPKTSFPREAYRWSNLYFCCPYCQQKPAQDFDADTLQPDDSGFNFERYFIWDFITGMLEPNPAASEDDKRRARATIKTYKLNEQHPALRKQWAHWFRKLSPDATLDSFPYRHFIQPNW